MLRNESSDKKQYERYVKRLGAENMPKTFDKFRDLKYNEVEKWLFLQDYYKSRGTNMISAFTTFDDYTEYKKRIEEDLIGITTVDGIRITSQSKHFIERVFGTSEDPHTGRPRDGVEIEDIKEALTKGRSKHRNDSLRYIANKCEVSVNNTTGMLIQTNPQ